MNKAHKIKINPTPEQEQYFWRCAGVARFTWNWALGYLNQGVPLNYLKLEFNRLRREEGFAEFVAEVQSYAYQYAFQDLTAALNRYFRMREQGLLIPPHDWIPRRDGRPYGWPRFKSRSKTTPAFGVANNGLVLDGHSAKIPRCPGLVNMAQPLRFAGRILGARVSYWGARWWMSVSVDCGDPPPHEHEHADMVGVHLGIKHMMLTTEGEHYENPRPLEKHLSQQKHLQRRLARQVRGSGRYKKTQKRLANLTARIADIRREAQHKATTELARKYENLALQEWDIKRMLQDDRFSRALSDVGTYEIRRQMEYKAAWLGGNLHIIPQSERISQNCSACGHEDNVPLSKRAWVCSACGAEHDREENAAENTRLAALRET